MQTTVTTQVNYKYELNNGLTKNGRWAQPSKKSFLQWWDDFSNFNVHNYQYYLVGGFINKEKTKDVDIVVTGEVNDQLYYVMKLAQEMGVKHNLMIDIFWQDKLYDFKKWTPIKRIRNFDQCTITRNNKPFPKQYGGVEVLKMLFENNYKKPYRDYIKGINCKNKYIKIKDFVNGTIN